MELELFSYIEKTIAYYKQHMLSYEYAMEQVKALFEDLMSENKDSVVTLHCRIKEEKSLKEKLIRNRFYLDFKAGEDALLNLTDLIGITIECRFIRNENEIYQSILKYFRQQDDAYAVCINNDKVFLNTRMMQPQYQRNGFTIYRLDGYIMFRERINFELQIKSMVHNFWSDIEHEMVYKNPDFTVFDRFTKDMLGAIRDNLDVVDHQLEIMHRQNIKETSHKQIGMDEQGFKFFTAQSINSLMNAKMIESFGFTTDFKKASATLAQYIYIKDFLNGDHNREMMVEYLEHLNYLQQSQINLRTEIQLAHMYEDDDIFCDTLGKYWQSVMNKDFQWHTFFVMLFEIEPLGNSDDFYEFVHVIKKLLVQPQWFETTFMHFPPAKRKEVRDALLLKLANAMIDSEKVEMIHEDNLHKLMGIFRRYTEFVEARYERFEDYEKESKLVCNELYRQLSSILKNEVCYNENS